MDKCMVNHVIDMHVAEYYFYIFFFDYSMDCFALPIAADYPAVQHALVNLFFLVKQVGCRRRRTTSLFYDVIQMTWMPRIINIYIHRCRYPHSHSTAIFCDINYFHITYYCYFFVLFVKAFINDIAYRFADFQCCDWFSSFFVFVYSDFIIFAICTFQN